MNHAQSVSFSVAGQAAWAPGIETPQAWLAWAQAPFPIADGADPAVPAMPPMLRRRAGFLGKMALQVAYQCLAGRPDIPTVFCSRHGEVVRSVTLLTDLAQDVALSPTAFGLAVHNASAGLFSIARADRASHQAVAAGASTIEHGVIDACSLLADGAPMVLLVAYDHRLPSLFAAFDDCHEQPHAWAWLMVPAADDPVCLSWSPASAHGTADADGMPAELPGGLEILRFALRNDALLERTVGPHRWRWTHGA